MTNPVEELARRRNAIPAPSPTGNSLPERVLKSRWTWIAVGMLLVYTAALAWLFTDIVANLQVNDDATGLNVSSIRQAAWLALPTVAFWTVLFLLADRYRPQRLVVWFLALGWGGAMAVLISYYVNSWAAEHLGVAGPGDPASAARAAIFIAPFVEEAAKASVVFLLAIFFRYRLTSKLSTIVLAGLSAAGFAFTENILYYARVIVYSSTAISAGDAQAALDSIVWLRGVWTSFAHPLFTMMTGIGIAVALRTHSKVVRVIAPLVGYLGAAFLHMLYNSQATFAQGTMMYVLYFAVALPMLLAGLFYVFRQIRNESRRVRSRLVDFVQLGWLPPRDPEVMARSRTRFHAGAVAITRGWTCFVDTIVLQRTLTELAYLRDGQVRGILDTGSLPRERELVEKAKALRATAISDPRGMKLNLPRWRRSKPVSYGPPNYPGPSGLAGSWPAPTSVPGRAPDPPR
ncbi:MAG TPA: PrsW family glutamic-type intramembrane protease [Propionicimonas sp.]|nr:PrsW family glutamic-type intramembrane protease [Propionicimonas sp.]